MKEEIERFVKFVFSCDCMWSAVGLRWTVRALLLLERDRSERCRDRSCVQKRRSTKAAAFNALTARPPCLLAAICVSPLSALDTTDWVSTAVL